jgi:hypothetical protein
MRNTSREIEGDMLISKYKIKNFHLVNLDFTQRLETIGIVTAKQILNSGLTKKDRKEIAQKSGVPEAYILELVKLSNLARISGLKKVRARLYYEAGVDTLEKLATWTPRNLCDLLNNFAKKTGMAKKGPLLGEVSDAISLAKHLPKIVKY